MQDSLNSISDDEIDLRELFVTLWAYKLFIACACAMGIVFGGYYALNADKEYTSSAIFKIDQSKSGGISLGGELGALASLAGFGGGSAASILPTDQVTGRIFIESLDAKLNFQADPYFNTYNPNSLDPLWKSLIKRAIGWQKSSTDPQEAIWQGIVAKYTKSIVLDETSDGAVRIVVTHVNPQRAAEISNVIMEEIISTLEKHQRYFPIFDSRDRLTNYFFVVANKKDEKKLITQGNKRVVEARLADAKFFWDKDRSKNLIKQIANLKSVTFYEKLGTIYDKTQRLRQLAGLLSDDLNINKEKVQVAASISKSDLCSDLVGEYPELQGVMGKYFALAQGFEEDVANSVSDHYLPTGLTSVLPKKPFSYSISIVDKIDTLVGFFVIDEKPTSSKDPFALRRAAIGLLRIIIENKLSFKLRDLINYAIRLYQEQGVKIINEKTEQQVLEFIKERMRNVLKLKNIKPDIIEASVSSHAGDNFLALYAKTILMNKYKNKGIGLNAISSYKRASNILDKAGKGITGRPDAVLFRKEEEKILHEKINEIRKAFTVKDDNKDYENLLIRLSETKESTDNFFDNVVVNDENQDIKNNRLELLKLFCNTFDNFIDFSKLEGL